MAGELEEGINLHWSGKFKRGSRAGSLHAWSYWTRLSSDLGCSLGHSGWETNLYDARTGPGHFREFVLELEDQGKHEQSAYVVYSTGMDLHRCLQIEPLVYPLSSMMTKRVSRIILVAHNSEFIHQRGWWRRGLERFLKCAALQKSAIASTSSL
jgi:hypothetical protein